MSLRFFLLAFSFICCLAIFPVGRASWAKEAAQPDDPILKLERVPPTSPEQALHTIEVADGFRIELAASEPLVVDPVAMAFDEGGRLYVVEMRDYSEQATERLGRVRMLTDEDGDGHFDKSIVFVEGLSWPTAIFCYDGGVFIGNAPDILYCKDRDGDGDADEQRVVFTGFSRDNVQGLLNSFQWGLDQRIYGSSSTTGGQITRPGSTAPPLDLRGRDFAFDPRTFQIEATTGGGQHGMSFNRWGDRFVCHNSDHLQAIVFEERYLARNPFQAIASARRSIAADGPQAEVFRASPVEAWREARTKMRLAGQASGPIEGGGRAAGYFTSGTGITVYEGGLWNATSENNAGLVYVADVGSNLIHRKRLMRDGVTYRGERIDRNTEFMRSTDIWFRPVQMAIGPDGALYVADMYREVIEHPLSLPPQLKRQLDLTSGNDRGRIYRIVPADYQPSPVAVLANATTADLVKSLDHPNIWRRMTASRLLYEQLDSAAIPLLRSQLSAGQRPEGRIATLYALRGTGALNWKDVLAALHDPHPQVRRHALRLSEPLLDSSPELCEKVLSMTSEPDLAIQFQLAFSLGECHDPRATRALAEIVIRHADEQDIVDAALTSIHDRAGKFLSDLLIEQRWLTAPSARRTLAAVVLQIVRQRRDEDLALLIDLLKKTDTSDAGRAALLKALTRLPTNSLDEGDSPYLAELQRQQRSAVQNLVREAIRLLQQDDTPLEERLLAIESLALDRFEKQYALFDELLAPHEPAVVRSAVLKVLADYSVPEVAELVLARWPEFSPTERSQATELLLRREAWVVALLHYLEAEKLPLTILEPAHIARLDYFPSNEVRGLTRKLRGDNTSKDKQQIFEEYREIALAGGDAIKGKLIFEKNCATCHQLSGLGETVGPNLSSMISRGTESILFNILAPSREVEPRFLEYVLTTADGQVITGLIAGETSTAVTLRGADGKTTTVLRSDIANMFTTGKSLMPEGFEKVIDKRSMADLLTYLQEAAGDQGESR
jgi:putative membrane-bound dehydrogenase-like protein